MDTDTTQYPCRLLKDWGGWNDVNVVWPAVTNKGILGIVHGGQDGLWSDSTCITPDARSRNMAETGSARGGRQVYAGTDDI